MNRVLFIVSGFLFSAFHFAAAQTTEPKLPLPVYLETIEGKFNVKFSYADETLKNIQITAPADTLNLAENITYLQLQTGFTFTVLNDRFIAISNPNPKKKIFCGYLIDQIDNRKIIGATILYEDKSTVSDSTGSFRIEVNEDSVELQIIAKDYYYYGLQSVFNDDSCLPIKLTPAVTLLDEVTIRNLITDGISKELDGVVVVDVRNMGLLPGLIEPDVLHSIQSLPGIQSINEKISDINVRGATSDQNLILWDGIKMYQSGNFFGMISAFNPYLNNTVRIIKNGSSAYYGDGVSSIIDIQSDTELSKEFSGGAGLNMLNTDAYLKIPISKKATLMLAGRRSVTDLLSTPTYNNYFERVFSNTDVIQNQSTGTDTIFNTNENFYFYDITGGLLLDISPKDKLNLHFLNISNDLSYQENLVTAGIPNSKTSSLTQNSLASGVHYKRNWTKTFDTNLEIYLSSYQLSAINYDLTNDQQLSQMNEVLDNGIKIDGSWYLDGKWKVISGYQFDEVGIGNREKTNNPEFERYVKEVIRVHSLFTETSYKGVKTGTNVRFGLRGNYYPKFKRFILEPRFSLQQYLGKLFYLDLLGELKSQNTTQIIDLQNDFLGVEKRRWVLANESDIPILRSRQVSLSLNYDRDRLFMSIEGFYKFVNGITSASQGFQNQFQYVRTSGLYEVFGGEFLINQHYNNLSLWASYTYSKNRYTFNDLSPAQFPNNLDVPHSVKGGANYSIKGFELSLGANWHSGKPFTVAESYPDIEIIYQSPNSSRLPDYFRADISLRYNFSFSAKTRGQVGVSIWNITNHTNTVNAYYREENGTVYLIEQYALGITPNAMVRVYF